MVAIFLAFSPSNNEFREVLSVKLLPVTKVSGCRALLAKNRCWPAIASLGSRS